VGAAARCKERRKGWEKEKKKRERNGLLRQPASFSITDNRHGSRRCQLSELKGEMKNDLGF
jgi:hypothetical protein